VTIDVTIGGAFAFRRARGQAALVPYVTAGHPRADATPDLLRAMADAGADVLELGVPFSDPLADGPTIQRSSFQSLSNGTTARRVLEWLSDFRRTHDTPVVLFTYLNPVVRYGVEAFLRDAVDAGAQGLLVTDLPAGADPVIEALIPASGLDLIRLVAPTTPPERIPLVARGGSGFLYYISRTGVTGAQAALFTNFLPRRLPPGRRPLHAGLAWTFVRDRLTLEEQAGIAAIRSRVWSRFSLEAMELDPSLSDYEAAALAGEILFHRGLDLVEEGRLDLARKAFDRAVRASPRNRNIYYSVAGVRRRLGEPGDARQLVDRGLAVDLDFADEGEPYRRARLEAIGLLVHPSSLAPAMGNPDATRKEVRSR
jgi:tryptophan synthase alpha subunit